MLGLAWGLDVAEQARVRAEGERDTARARDAAARMAVAQLATTSGGIWISWTERFVMGQIVA